MSGRFPPENRREKCNAVVPREHKISRPGTVVKKTVPGLFLFVKSNPGQARKRGEQDMEFMTGVKKKEDISVKTLLEIPEGTEVKLEGAVHIIRDMGEVAFVILRKSEGLVQCVYEEGSVDFPLKDLKEESAVAVTGTVKKEDRAPGGVEVRLQTITVLSEPTEPMPLAVNKWKMNTSLEAMLNMRPIALRNVRERAKFRIQEGVVRAFRDFLHSPGIHRNSYTEDRRERR